MKLTQTGYQLSVELELPCVNSNTSGQTFAVVKSQKLSFYLQAKSSETATALKALYI